MGRRPQTKPFSVDTSPSKDIVVDGLTRDVSVEACIFDLIDNSIDAARDTAFKDVAEEERAALLPSYDGFEISVQLDTNGVKIIDNCGGISISALKHMVLKFGKKSDHQMGIGVFGVGLNRALFKLGRVSHLRTDTGAERAALILRNDEYLKSDDWLLPAEQLGTTGKAGTEIEITRTPEDISHLFADVDWVGKLQSEVGRRYSRFLGKGLKLEINGIDTVPFEPLIREDGPFDGKHKFYKTDKGVSVHIRFGQHEKHRFSKEKGHSLTTNSALTPQYGWTVFCNDRAILVADHTDRTGWDRWHTEYNGFIGTVEFISAKPAILPWDTTKFNVDLNNPAYRLALIDMKKFNEEWRSFSDQRKKPSSTLKTIPQKKTPASGQKAPDRKNKPDAQPKSVGPRAPKKSPIVKEDYHQFRTVLPDDVNEHLCNDKHLAVVHEAKGLDLGDCTFAGMALIRMLFEFSVITFLHRSGKYDELQKAALEMRRAKGLKIKVEEEKQITPAMEEILPYLDKNSSVWGAKQNHLKHALKKMMAYGPTLNSAVHNPFQPFNRTKAFEIRDEVLPLLRHLIET